MTQQTMRYERYRAYTTGASKGKARGYSSSWEVKKDIELKRGNSRTEQVIVSPDLRILHSSAHITRIQTIGVCIAGFYKGRRVVLMDNVTTESQVWRFQGYM